MRPRPWAGAWSTRLFPPKSSATRLASRQLASSPAAKPRPPSATTMAHRNGPTGSNCPAGHGADRPTDGKRREKAGCVDLKPGSRWASQVCDTEVVVVRGASQAGFARMRWASHGARWATSRASGLELDPSFAGGSLIGKRFAAPRLRPRGAGHQGGGLHAGRRWRGHPAQGSQAPPLLGLRHAACT